MVNYNIIAEVVFCIFIIIILMYIIFLRNLPYLFNFAKNSSKKNLTLSIINIKETPLIYWAALILSIFILIYRIFNH